MIYCLPTTSYYYTNSNFRFFFKLPSFRILYFLSCIYSPPRLYITFIFKTFLIIPDSSKMIQHRQTAHSALWLQSNDALLSSSVWKGTNTRQPHPKGSLPPLGVFNTLSEKWRNRRKLEKKMEFL